MATFLTRRRGHMINQVFYSFGHKYIYDFDELEYHAGLAGFTTEAGCEVRQASYRSGSAVADRDAEVHRDESFYAELVCFR